MIVLVPLGVPSDWAQDVPQRYGQRRPGTIRSALYPVVDAPATE